MTELSQKFHDQLVEALDWGDDDKLRQFLIGVNPADVAEAMELLEDIKRSRILFALDSAAAAEVIVLLDEWLRDEVVEDLTGDRLAEMINEMPPDDAADVVGELTTDQTDQLLEKLSIEQSERIEQLLQYDNETAGGLMNPDMLCVPETATVGQAIDYLREADVSDDEALVIYTTNSDGCLTGTVSPHRLLISSPARQLLDILTPEPVSVTVEEDQEHIVNVMRKYDLAALPVVDAAGKLVGHITVDDVLDVAAEEAEEDFFLMAGTDAAELESSSIFRAATIRLVWLVPSFMFMTGTMAVMATSEKWFESKEIHVALLTCVPLIGALAGGCSVQTSTVITRGLATGELAGSKLGFAFNREARIALVMAPVCALLAFGLVSTVMPVLQTIGWVNEVPIHNVISAVGIGMLAAILTASILGISMPFVFRRVGIDPAIAAGPVVTTANDVICVTIYLVLAYWIVQR